MHIPRFQIDPTVAAEQIIALRTAVGWGGLEADYPAALPGYWAYIGGFNEAEELVAWCAVISDGTRHAVLLDVIVHPAWQRRGVGQALVAQAVAHIRAHGITVIHIDFLPEHAAFYERCGFKIGMGGIHEAENAKRRAENVDYKT